MSAFIKEASNLAYSLLRIDFNKAIFEKIFLIDSYLVNVRNVVRFKATDWTFVAPFSASSITKETAVF